MRKYIFSGLPLSVGGVGKLLTHIVPIGRKFHYRFVYKNIRPSFAVLLKERKYFRIMSETVFAFYKQLEFWYCTNFFRNCEIIIAHPQTLGFSAFFKLAKNNLVHLYLMDNSFFCMKSYNYIDGELTDCIRCIGNPGNHHSSCYPFPVKYSREENFEFIQKLKGIASKISFLLQNENQSLLLKKHFGDSVNFRVVGMNTGEIDMDQISYEPPKSKPVVDFVFHGSCGFMKGIHIVIDLAEKMPGFSFFIPISKNEVETYLQKKIASSNIEFRECKWDSGLKYYIENCRVVLNPSLWSAVIEGALLKSIAFNGNVAVCPVNYGFINEIPQDCLIRLTEDAGRNTIILGDFIKNKTDISNKSKGWLKEFMLHNDPEKIFR